MAIRFDKEYDVCIGIQFRLYKSKAYETDPSLSVDGEKDKGRSGL